MELLERHNAAQREYFERTEKATMVPAGSRYVRRQVEELMRFAELAPGMRVLDVGCGMGRYTLPLAARGLKVEGMDISPRLLERLRAFAGEGSDIPLHHADVLDPPTALGGVFDAVIGFFTLHHLHDLRRCFEGMVLLAKPGAAVAFLEPNPFNPSYYVQLALTPGMSWEGDGGLVRMRRRVVEPAMRGAGLADFRLERFGALPPRLANRARGPALERALERSIPRPLLAFQLFGARRP